MSKYVNPTSIAYMENHHIVNILVHTYSSMWNKLNDLGLQTPSAWMLPTDAHQTNPKNPLFLMFNKFYYGIALRKKTAVFELVFDNIKIVSVPLMAAPAINDCLIFNAVVKHLGSCIEDGLDELLIAQAVDLNASVTLLKAAHEGFLTKQSVVETWIQIKTDFKNALYASRGMQGYEEQIKAQEYLIQHPLILKGLARDARSLIEFEKTWIKTLLVNTNFLYKT